MHRFGWTFGGATQSSQGGYFRQGRRIPVNAKSAGRRRGKSKKGKGKTLQGRPKGIRIGTFSILMFLIICVSGMNLEEKEGILYKEAFLQENKMVKSGRTSIHIITKNVLTFYSRHLH